MTLDELKRSVEESGHRAGLLDDGAIGDSAPDTAAQWMQVKMLAEIARQLAVMNRGNCCIKSFVGGLILLGIALFVKWG